MSAPGTTLHDFVLNLISDANARTAFQLDPDGALNAAGLGDVTAADVQEAIPLVVDYVPASVAGLDTTLSELASGSVGGDRLGAIHQLQAVTNQLPLAGVGMAAVDLSLAASGTLGDLTGAVSADVSGVLQGEIGPVQYGGDVSGSVDFSTATDPTSTLDANVLDGAGDVSGTIGGTVDTVGSLTGSLTNTLDGLTGGATDGVVGDLTGVVDGATHGLTADVLDTGGVLDVTGTLTSTTGLDAVTGTVDSLGLGGSGDVSADTSAAADAHLLDLSHLL